MRAALDTYKGRDVKVERQKRLRKQAEKKKKTKREDDIPVKDVENDMPHEHVGINLSEENNTVDGDGWETEEKESAPAAVCVNHSIYE